MNYSVEILNSEKKNILNYSEIFQFYDSKYCFLFKEYYTFCRKNLDIQSKQFGIKENIFLFTNSFEVNAMALLKNNQFVILINLGLIKFCIENYFENELVEFFFNSKYKNTCRKFDNRVGMLAFQFVTQFTYYHELAHLLQFSKKNISHELSEINKNNTDFNLVKHKLELNADVFASISMATHLQQYVIKITKNGFTVVDIKNTVVIMGVCILNYVLNFSNGKKIYLKENSHPHPFIRLFNIISCMISHLENSPLLRAKNIKIESKELILEIIDNYKELEKQLIFQTDFSNSIPTEINFHLEIIEYIKEISDFDIVDYNDAVFFWNSQNSLNKIS